MAFRFSCKKRKKKRKEKSTTSQYSKMNKLKKSNVIASSVSMDNQLDLSDSMDLKNELTAKRRAQLDCILRILQNFIKKLKICLNVPFTLNNLMKFGKEDLQDSKERFWLQMIEDYCACEKASYRSKEILVKMMDFLDDHMEAPFLWTNCISSISAEDKSLIELFNRLCKISEDRLSKSALSDLSKEKKLNKLHRNCIDAEKSFAEYTEKLRKNKIKRFWELGYKGALIHKYEEDLAVQKWDNNMRIKQEIVRSSKNIQSLQEISSRILEELDVVVSKKRIAYKKLLHENLMLERDARIEKKKLLFQLQTYIRKYDQNVGDKIKEKMQLKRDYEENKKKFDEFIIEYRRQEEEYTILLQQKQKEDEEIFEHKLMVFMMGRAARVIQVNWRRFRRDQKKKSKRGKGKGKRK